MKKVRFCYYVIKMIINREMDARYAIKNFP